MALECRLYGWTGVDANEENEAFYEQRCLSLDAKSIVIAIFWSSHPRDESALQGIG